MIGVPCERLLVFGSSWDLWLKIVVHVTRPQDLVSVFLQNLPKMFTDLDSSPISGRFGVQIIKIHLILVEI
jgi:hypothetical protein